MSIENQTEFLRPIAFIRSLLYIALKHKYNCGMHIKNQKGFANNLLIATIGLSILSFLSIGAAIWGFVSYNNQKTDVDSRVAEAVALAKKEQADSDEEKFTAREKEPNRQFAGPDDYGGLSFDYPKTWSVYVNKDTSSGGSYEAYLNPLTVPTVSVSQQYALRVTIQDKDYDQVIKTYEPLVKNGSLTSSSIKVNDASGTRLDGTFSKDIKGYAVIFKIRDKTLTMRADAETFKNDFNKIVPTIKFNQ